MVPRKCSVCGKLTDTYARCSFQKCSRRFCWDCIRKPIEQYIRGEINETPTHYIGEHMFWCCINSVELFITKHLTIEEIPLYMEIPWYQPTTVKRLKKRLEGRLRRA